MILSCLANKGVNLANFHFFILEKPTKISWQQPMQNIIVSDFELAKTCICNIHNVPQYRFCVGDCKIPKHKMFVLWNVIKHVFVYHDMLCYDVWLKNLQITILGSNWIELKIIEKSFCPKKKFEIYLKYIWL